MTLTLRAWQSPKNWRDALVKPIVPQGESVGRPLSVRFPDTVIKQLDAVAKATGNPRAVVVLHLVRWALEEYERQRAEESTGKRA